MLERIQNEHKEWLAREYPDQPAWLPAAGLVEEAGELLRCLIRLYRQQRWGEEARYSGVNWEAELIDAIGDCAVYCCSLCNATGRSFAEVCNLKDVPFTTTGWTPLQLAAGLLHAGVSIVNAPENFHLVGIYMSWLKAVSAALRIGWESALQVTWEKVRRRTKGQKRPRKVCLCGSTRFKEEFIAANFEETMAGRIVMTVGWFSHVDGAVFTPNAEQKAAIDELHLRKIDEADEVRVIGRYKYCRFCRKELVGSPHATCCGKTENTEQYIGESTAREIAYAERTGKPVRYA